MILLDGKRVSEKVLNDVKSRVEQMSVKPHLVVILVGDDPASKIYVKNKKELLVVKLLNNSYYFYFASSE